MDFKWHSWWKFITDMSPTISQTTITAVVFLHSLAFTPFWITVILSHTWQYFPSIQYPTGNQCKKWHFPATHSNRWTVTIHFYRHVSSDRCLYCVVMQRATVITFFPNDVVNNMSCDFQNINKRSLSHSLGNRLWPRLSLKCPCIVISFENHYDLSLCCWPWVFLRQTCIYTRY